MNPVRKSLEFFFDVGSPSSYLAWMQLPALCDSHGASCRPRSTKEP